MEEWVLVHNDRIVKRFSIENGQCLTIGRDADADIVINNTAISRKHTSLELMGGSYYLTDLYSLNGTKVNGKQIVSSVPISKNDLIEVGKFILKPAEYLTGEAEAGSVAANPDSFNQTIYVSGLYKRSLLNKEKKPKKYNELTVLEGKASPETLSLKGRGSIRAGKDITSDLILAGWFIGNPQFFITHRGDGYYIVHNKSLLHRMTSINGKPLKGERKLRKKDIISVGSIRIQFN
ncbi:MAG: FHA domain-containing protein [Proteobacteria bacterium]|nr:FHA domain-containing protein [Pseudomonadota bacterium]MBU1737904.1 FHA domain-containing protein [Pseudomonadota bacterium]